MEERIRFITHKGKEILIVDCSQCGGEELKKITRLAPQFVMQQPKGSVLLLADFTGAQINREVMQMLKRGTVFDRPHLKRSAWVGVESFPKVFYENLKSFSQRELPAFQTREEAMDWLVGE